MTLGPSAATFTPSLEMELRLDGGDAATGFGANIGAGLASASPEKGLTLELKARGLMAHEAAGSRVGRCRRTLLGTATAQRARPLGPAYPVLGRCPVRRHGGVAPAASGQQQAVDILAAAWRTLPSTTMGAPPVCHCQSVGGRTGLRPAPVGRRLHRYDQHRLRPLGKPP
ncbi:hypothetical protein [Candidatus Synechococcus spongiarum]|uniref:Uncharacterized protein n=1 Tax=Candidatus Synechococcus spongiarum TaxID=431041 RepID=A0A164Y0B4_9SYNE|nr:hypothetical protein [Candidatus Synechococcus spongiarum]SAY38234.1 hypothetical protein FLM9_14 [Candidatus Synechococcus spongiarum]